MKSHFKFCRNIFLTTVIFLLCLNYSSNAQEYKGDPKKLNPDGHGPLVVDHVFVGNSGYLITPGTDSDSKSVLYYSSPVMNNFMQVRDDHNLYPKDNSNIYKSQKTISDEGFVSAYKSNSGDYDALLILRTGSGNPFIEHLWSYNGTENFYIKTEVIRKDNVDYFGARTEISSHGYTDNIYGYKSNGLKNITNYSIPASSGTGAVMTYPQITRDAIYVQTHDMQKNESIFLHIYDEKATPVKHDGENLEYSKWMGYTINSTNQEHVFVLGYENGTGGGQEYLYKISGSDATKLRAWTDYTGYPNFLGVFNGSSYLWEISKSGGEEVLITISGDGNVEEIEWPKVSGNPVKVHPIWAEGLGVWFLDENNNLWYKETGPGGWLNVNIKTDRLTVHDDKIFIAGSRQVEIDGVPKTEKGIYKVQDQRPGIFLSLIWEAKFDYDYVPEKLTYFNDKLYFVFSGLVPAKHQGTHYIPLGEGGTSAVKPVQEYQVPKAYPNPVTQMLNYEIPEIYSGAEILVTNMQGVVVEKLVADKAFGKINFAHVPVGLYNIVFKKEGKQQIVRVAKTH